MRAIATLMTIDFVRIGDILGEGDITRKEVEDHWIGKTTRDRGYPGNGGPPNDGRPPDDGGPPD